MCQQTDEVCSITEDDLAHCHFAVVVDNVKENDCSQLPSPDRDGNGSSRRGDESTGDSVMSHAEKAVAMGPRSADWFSMVASSLDS